MYCIQHCFICRPSDSHVWEDAGIEPRLLRLRHWQSNALCTRSHLLSIFANSTIDQNININQTAHNKNGRILFNFTQPFISWMVLWSDRVGKRLHTSYRSGTGGWGGQTRQQLASLAGPMIDRPSHLMKHLSL
jgi:hypothetical protein